MFRSIILGEYTIEVSPMIMLDWEDRSRYVNSPSKKPSLSCLLPVPDGVYILTRQIPQYSTAMLRSEGSRVRFFRVISSRVIIAEPRRVFPNLCNPYIHVLSRTCDVWPFVERGYLGFGETPPASASAFSMISCWYWKLIYCKCPPFTMKAGWKCYWCLYFLWGCVPRSASFPFVWLLPDPLHFHFFVCLGLVDEGAALTSSSNWGLPFCSPICSLVLASPSFLFFPFQLRSPVFIL